MKTTKAITWLAVCASALTAVFRASADESATAATAKNEKNYTGIVTSIDPKEHALKVKNWTAFNKAFSLGENCFYAQVENNNATANDLRPGEKVRVSYQDVHGVLIASRVEQEPMRFEGMVGAIDNDKHTLTMHRPALDKELQFPNDCKIVLRNGKSGAAADIKVGNYVTATYETPGNQPTLRQIAQTSTPFTGTLTAVDLNEKTVKAKTFFTSKKFNVADNCAIIVNGKPDGKLSDLKLNDRRLFNYDEVNGVDVVTRIGPPEAPADSVAAAPPPAGY